MKKIVATFIIAISLLTVVGSADAKFLATFLGPISIETDSQNGNNSSIGFDLDKDGILDAIFILEGEKTIVFEYPGQAKSSTSGIAKNKWYSGLRNQFGKSLPQAINESDPRPLVNVLMEPAESP